MKLFDHSETIFRLLTTTNETEILNKTFQSMKSFELPH